MAREIELHQGRVGHGIVQPTFEKIKLSVADMIEIYYDSIYKDSRKRNERIDTPQEYQRVEQAIRACEERI